MRPFEGIKVLDITHVLAGPFATYQLAVLGAEVIKIEHPVDCDQSRHTGASAQLNAAQMGTNFLAQNSNKRSLTLDLKHPKGSAILKDLVRSADVLVENFRSHALDQLGLGAQALRAINPRLIYCSVTGFGHEGQRASQTAYDHAIQAMSGILESTGTKEGEAVKAGAPVVDYATGMMAAFAVASALFQRERTGAGQTIDLSMLDTALLLQSTQITGFTAAGIEPTRRGNKHNFASQNLYDTREGQIMLAASNIREQTRLFQALGYPERAHKSYQQRAAGYKEEEEFLAGIMLEKTAQEWEDYLQSMHVPALRVRKLPEILDDPQLTTRTVLHQHPQIPGLGSSATVPVCAFTLEHGGPSIEIPPPHLGQHTFEILRSLGFNETAIHDLQAENVI
jgi:crotonobetainyl-CoA:carnitine CoA-transferase CaiB-like acyl-CoA transferase